MLRVLSVCIRESKVNSSIVRLQKARDSAT